MYKTRLSILILALCGLFASPSFVRAEEPAQSATAEPTGTPAAAPATTPAAVTATPAATAESPAPTTVPAVSPSPSAVPAAANAPTAKSFENAFQTGLEAYQKQNYAAAQSLFNQALTFRPQDTSTLLNLALTHARQDHKGWALAMLRRVLALDPGHSEARKALDFMLKQNQLHEIPHQIESWESLHTALLSQMSLFLIALLTLFLFFAAGWSWLSYLGARKRAMTAETAMPTAPLLPIFFLLLLLASAGLAGAKILDEREARATVVVDKVSVLTDANEQAPSLFDLFEGLEVIVLQTKGDWMQISYPGGMTGWVPKASLFLTQKGNLP